MTVRQGWDDFCPDSIVSRYLVGYLICILIKWYQLL